MDIPALVEEEATENNIGWYEGDGIELSSGSYLDYLAQDAYRGICFRLSRNILAVITTYLVSGRSKVVFQWLFTTLAWPLGYAVLNYVSEDKFQIRTRCLGKVEFYLWTNSA